MLQQPHTVGQMSSGHVCADLCYMIQLDSILHVAAAPVSESDVPGIAHIWFQQPGQCCLYVSHVSEQWLAQPHLPILTLVLAFWPTHPLPPSGRPFHAGPVCCIAYLLLR